MDITDLVEEAKKQHLSFEKHPVKKLDLEGKTHYLNGLALMLNADAEINEKEKEYFIILLRTFELPDSELEKFIKFAEEPNEKSVIEMIKSFEDKSIQYCFIMDLLLLAYYDHKFHKKEKKLVEQFADIFKFTEAERNALFDLHENIFARDKDGINVLLDEQDYFSADTFEYLLEYFNLSESDETEDE